MTAKRSEIAKAIIASYDIPFSENELLRGVDEQVSFQREQDINRLVETLQPGDVVQIRIGYADLALEIDRESTFGGFIGRSLGVYREGVLAKEDKWMGEWWVEAKWVWGFLSAAD